MEQQTTPSGGGPPRSPLTTLPPEIILLLLSHLPPSSVLSVSETCRTLLRIARSDDVWRPVCEVISRRGRGRLVDRSWDWRGKSRGLDAGGIQLEREGEEGLGDGEGRGSFRLENFGAGMLNDWWELAVRFLLKFSGYLGWWASDAPFTGRLVRVHLDTSKGVIVAEELRAFNVYSRKDRSELLRLDYLAGVGAWSKGRRGTTAAAGRREGEEGWDGHGDVEDVDGDGNAEERGTDETPEREFDFPTLPRGARIDTDGSGYNMPLDHPSPDRGLNIDIFEPEWRWMPLFYIDPQIGARLSSTSSPSTGPSLHIDLSMTPDHRAPFDGRGFDPESESDQDQDQSMGVGMGRYEDVGAGAGGRRNGGGGYDSTPFPTKDVYVSGALRDVEIDPSPRAAAGPASSSSGSSSSTSTGVGEGVGRRTVEGEAGKVRVLGNVLSTASFSIRPKPTPTNDTPSGSQNGGGDQQAGGDGGVGGDPRFIYQIPPPPPPPGRQPDLVRFLAMGGAPHQLAPFLLRLNTQRPLNEMMAAEREMREAQGTTFFPIHGPVGLPRIPRKGATAPAGSDGIRADSLNGLWCGSYGPHGKEFGYIVVRTVDLDEPPDFMDDGIPAGDLDLAEVGVGDEVMPGAFLGLNADGEIQDEVLRRIRNGEGRRRGGVDGREGREHEPDARWWRRNNRRRRVVEYVKLTGDPNVPRGETSWVAYLPDEPRAVHEDDGRRSAGMEWGTAGEGEGARGSGRDDGREDDMGFLETVTDEELLRWTNSTDPLEPRWEQGTAPAKGKLAFTGYVEPRWSPAEATFIRSRMTFGDGEPEPRRRRGEDAVMDGRNGKGKTVDYGFRDRNGGDGDEEEEVQSTAEVVDEIRLRWREVGKVSSFRRVRCVDGV